MPVRFKYNQDKEVLYGTIDGVVSMEELTEALKEIVSSERFPVDANTLWDCRNLDFSVLDSNFGYELAQLRSNFPQRKGARLAIVVSSERGFGLSRMYEMLSADLPQIIMVFRDYAEAEDWIMGKPSEE